MTNMSEPITEFLIESHESLDRLDNDLMILEKLGLLGFTLD
jgi:hypothetical protein